MKKESLTIDKTPALLFGNQSDTVYLYVHGMGGNKEEAELFATIVTKLSGQVLSIDLPKTFTPWDAVPKLQAVMKYVRARWEHVSLYGNSIGAYFSMLSFDGRRLEKCLFHSPVLDMDRLISGWMLSAGVSDERLEREQTIPNPYGPTFSWEYLRWVREHPISDWSVPTSILYGAKDIMVDRETVDAFVHRHGCALTVMEDGEHWFHTDAHLDFLRAWAEECLRNP